MEEAFSRIIFDSAVIPAAFARTMSAKEVRPASADGATFRDPTAPGRSPGVRRISLVRDPASDPSSSVWRRPVKGLSDSKGCYGGGWANAAVRGVDVPVTTSVQGVSVRWEGVSTDRVVADPAGRGDVVRD